MLVPVSLGGSSGQPGDTPVIRVLVGEPGLGSGLGRAWLLLATLGLVLLGGALVLADRLGRSYVRPSGRPGRTRTHAGHDRPADGRPRPTRDRGGATGGSRARRDAEPPGRPRRGAARARAAGSLRPVPSPAHPGDRAAAAHRGGHRPGRAGTAVGRPRRSREHGRPRGARSPALRARGAGRRRRRAGRGRRAGGVLARRWRRTRIAPTTSTSRSPGPARYGSGRAPRTWRRCSTR